MKPSRFNDTPLVAVLKQAEAESKVKLLCRELGRSDATYYKWKAKAGALESSDLKYLNETETVSPILWHSFGKFGKSLPVTRFPVVRTTAVRAHKLS